jgi:crotonobetainyl-CoA:carnitine CoA-transferase CaiB-like acyl-CoA transferase
VAEHAQSAVRQMFPVLDHATAGPHRVTGTPVKLSATPGRPGMPAPILGEHTGAVLEQLLGLEPEAVKTLADRGVILEWHGPPGP